MKFFTNKETTKKIIIAVLLVMTFNFISPATSQAIGNTPRGGKLFEPLFQLTCGIADLFLKGMQYIFMGDGDIMEEDPTVQGGKSFYIEYSPGAIFSNKVAALDVNFFNPGPDYQVTEEKSKTTELKRDTISKVNSSPTQAEIDAKKNSLLSGYGYDATKAKEVNNYATIDGVLGAFSGMNGSRKVWSWEYNGNVYYYIQDYTTATSTPSSTTPAIPTTTFMYTLYLLEENNSTSSTTGETIKSSASVLQNTIATWYKALRAFALVGLLSVLVYIGIRILISSTGQEKAKYKKMVMDWVAAMCILFVLQYVMIFTLKVTESITEILSVQVIGENGRDDLMSDLRQNIGGEDETEIDYTTFETFINTIMYIALVIETGIFSVHYLKRLVYMAFFTMIAPLVALTYPLDKIKDGQAQAFSTLIKEYIFNALIQPVHLLLYYIFISSAISLAVGNPLYAVVALGFMMPAEKFFRKMFGFEKASSVSQVGAAAGGALVMNAINKMGQKAGKVAAGGSGTPKTANGAGGSGSAGAPGSVEGPKFISEPSHSPRSSPTGTPGVNAFGEDIKQGEGRLHPGPVRALKGAGSLAGHYINRGNAIRGLKGVGRAARKVAIGGAGATVLGTIGLASGVATGSLENAFKYGAAGAGAGYMGANAVGDRLTAIEKKNRDIFSENTLGTKEYNTRNSIRTLTRDNDFNKMCRQLGVHGQKERSDLIRQFYSNGITNPEDIKKAINAGASTSNSNTDELIAAAKIKQEAQRYGHKKKDIEDRLRGLPQGDFDRAMELIDLM